MTERTNGRLKMRSREYRRALVAHLRAGGDLKVLGRQTGIGPADLQLLLDGRIHWVSASCASALEDRMRVPACVEYPELQVGMIPVHVLLPYMDALVERHGVTVAGEVCGLPPRRLLNIRTEQPVVEIGTADKIVLAAEGALAWRDDPKLRRWYWAALPDDVLRKKKSRDQARYQGRRRRLAAQITGEILEGRQHLHDELASVA